MAPFSVMDVSSCGTSLVMKQAFNGIYISVMWQTCLSRLLNHLVDKKWQSLDADLALGSLVSLTWISLVDEESIRKGLMGFLLSSGLTSGVYCLLCNVISIIKFIISC